MDNIKNTSGTFEVITVVSSNPCKACAFSRDSIYKNHCAEVQKIKKCIFKPNEEMQVYKFLNNECIKEYKYGEQIKLDLF